jgi:hypothetical protein
MTSESRDQVLKCTRCERIKPSSDFPANSKKRNGRSSWCRDCSNEAAGRSRKKAAEREAATRLVESKAETARLNKRLREQRRWLDESRRRRAAA